LKTNKNEKDLDKMMMGICPKCPVGIPIEEKITDEIDTWRITCPSCGYSIVHHLPPIEEESICPDNSLCVIHAWPRFQEEYTGPFTDEDLDKAYEEFKEKNNVCCLCSK